MKKWCKNRTLVQHSVQKSLFCICMILRTQQRVVGLRSDNPVYTAAATTIVCTTVLRLHSRTL